MNRTAAAAITLRHATHGKLPRAALLLRLNDPLDVLGSSTRLGSCFKRRAISSLHPATAGEHQQILQDSDAWLQRWTVDAVTALA